MTEKRAGNISTGQKEILIEFLNVHPELVSAKFSSNFSHKNAQILWNEVANTLNALPGAKKTWCQWRKAWHDMRTKVKGKKADINKSFKKTGGGPQAEISMTSIDNNVAKLIGPTIIYGDAVIDESVAEFCFSSPENDNETTTYLRKNNTDMSRTVSGCNDVLKGNIDSISTLASTTQKLPVQECSLNECEKENEPSIFKYPANSNIVLAAENTNKKRDTNSNIILNNPIKDLVAKTVVTPSTKGRTKTKSQRFDETLSYTKNLSDNAQHDLELRKQYYKKKIHLMERDIIAKERIAAAMESFCAISNRVDHFNYEDMDNLDETEQNT